MCVVLTLTINVLVGCGPDDATTSRETPAGPDSTASSSDNFSEATSPTEDTTTNGASANDVGSSSDATSTDAAASSEANEDSSQEASSVADSANEPASTSNDGPASLRTALGEPLKPNSEGVYEIIFEDIQLPIQADVVFRPFMLTDRAQALDGQRIRINGYMLPDSKTKGITQFVLLKNTECKFGPGGQADHLINVLMVDGVTAKYRDTPISIEGVLKINPFRGPDGNTWSIYDLACDHVESYEPRR